MQSLRSFEWLFVFCYVVVFNEYKIYSVTNVVQPIAEPKASLCKHLVQFFNLIIDFSII